MTNQDTPAGGVKLEAGIAPSLLRVIAEAAVAVAEQPPGRRGPWEFNEAELQAIAAKARIHLADPSIASNSRRFHFTNEAPVSIATQDGEVMIGEGWLAITEAEYSALAALPAAGAAEPDRVTQLESALLGAIEAIESLSDDALGYNTMGDGSVPGGQASWPIKDELLHNLRNVLSAAPPAPSGGEPEPVAWTDKNGLEFLARGYGIDVSAEAGTTGRTIPLFASPPKPSEAMVEKPK